MLRRPRWIERWERLRATSSFGIVLALIVVSFTLAMALPESDWSQAVLVAVSSATLTLALWTAGVSERTVLLAASAALVLVAIAAASAAVGGQVGRIALAVSWGTMIAATPIAIVHGLRRSLEVTARTVTGALCVYLLIGMFFSAVFATVAAIEDAPFFVDGKDVDTSTLVYYSYITQATVGFGDFTSASDVGRALSAVEGLLGQIYLVTVVALVVSNLGRRRTDPDVTERLL